MKNKIQLILQEHKNYLVEKFGVSEIALFGSYARREESYESDIERRN